MTYDYLTSLILHFSTIGHVESSLIYDYNCGYHDQIIHHISNCSNSLHGLI